MRLCYGKGCFAKVSAHPVTGPFRGCRTGHVDGTALPLAPVPAETLDDPAFSAHAEDPFLPWSGGRRP